MSVSPHVADERLPPKFVTRNEYARMRGLSFAAVEKAIFEGRMTLLPGALVDPEAADREWAASTGPGRGEVGRGRGTSEGFAGGNGGANGTHTLTQLRAQEVQLKLKLLEAEVAKAEGEQVAVAEVERAQFERARRMRDEMLLVSQRVGPQLHMIDWRQAARIVDVAIREALGGGPASVEAAPKKKRRGRK